MARQELLDAVVDHLRTHGLGDRSLREIAAAIGSSHRMLLYHFGSREGLLAAVVAEVERQERERTAAAAAAGGARSADATEVVERLWASVAHPSRADELRLFFELAALAIRGTPGTEVLRDALVTPWLDLAERIAPTVLPGVTPATVRSIARLDTAVVRGLLLDLLATGDRRGVQASFRRYLAWRRQGMAALATVGP